MRTRIPRPFRLLAAVAGLLLVLTSGCSATQNAAPASDASSAGPWSFTDDLGKTVTLDHSPAPSRG